MRMAMMQLEARVTKGVAANSIRKTVLHSQREAAHDRVQALGGAGESVGEPAALIKPM